MNRRPPEIRTLSPTDGYVGDRHGRSWGEVEQTILALHKARHKIEPSSVRVHFRHESAPRLVGGGIRTGYNLLPTEQ